MGSVSYQRKVGDWFFPELLVFYNFSSVTRFDTNSGKELNGIRFPALSCHLIKETEPDFENL
jgi:hypothetical protein